MPQSSIQYVPIRHTLALPYSFSAVRVLLSQWIHQYALCCLTWTLLAASHGVAQESPSKTQVRTDWIDSSLRARFGMYGQFNINQHNGNFRDLPGVPTCCPQVYGTGFGTGFSGGVLVDVPFSRTLGLSLRASYTQPSGLLVYNQRDSALTFVNRDQNRLDTASVRHSIDAALGNIGIEAFLTIKPFAPVLQDGLTVLLGGRIGYAMQRSISKRERIVDAPVTFETGSKERLPFDGNIPTYNPLFGSIMAGINYDIPLNSKHTLFLTPEIFGSLGLTTIAHQRDWRVNQLRAGIALKIMPERPEPVLPDTTRSTPPQTTPPTTPVVVMREDTPITATPTASRSKDTLAASVRASAVEYDGSEYENNITFRVEEFFSENLRPLLPYVFFDEGSSDIPDRYNRLRSRETKDFHVDHLHNLDVIQTYHHILNIVGARMRKYPQATLTITGCNDFATSEKGDLELSRRRAERVRDYLLTVWNIEPSRLSLKAQNLSDVPTVMGTKNYPNEVHQENRRVELASNVYEILEPVRTADTVRTVSPPIIRFRPTVLSTQPLASWSIKASQNKKLLKEFFGAGKPPETLDWEIAQMQENVPRAPTPMEYSLAVTDATGRTFQTPIGRANVEQITIQKKRRERLNDKVIDRYRLILFDFDKATITPLQQRIIDYIKGQITPQSTVTIAGYTDYTNPLDYSQRLSKARAESTVKALNLDDRAIMSVKGIGKSVLLHDNSIPEGRFYCRTVSIVVETPLEAR